MQSVNIIANHYTLGSLLLHPRDIVFFFKKKRQDSYLMEFIVSKQTKTGAVDI